MMIDSARTRNWFWLCLLLLLISLSCRKQAAPAAEGTSTANAASKEKRYHLVGKVVSIDKQSKMVTVDSEAIPGFMEAMTMPYAVKPESELDHLSPGDRITGDVVVGDSGMWLEKIVVTSHATTPAAK